MSAPRWAGALLRRLAPPDRAADVLGDLEEAHRGRVERRGPVVASVLSGLEALDLAVALLRERFRARIRRGSAGRRPTGSEAGSEVRSAERGRKGPSISWLDVKLGVRMLVKYPGLTLVGGLAMAFAIAIGAAYLEVVNDFRNPTLPLEDGERIVGIQNWDAAAAGPELRSLHDFVNWRDALESVEELGAFRTIERNLITGEGSGEPVEVAEISASAFRLTRVLPLLGRPLLAEDEREGAPPVVVIGYDVWRRRLASDPDVVGREVRLGDAVHTVVGVMPEGFAFPVRHHLWVPLHVNALGYGPREGPGISVFGRLAPGATLADARAELAALGLRAAADFPDTHEHLRPRVVPYTRLFFDGGGASQLYWIESVFVMVLVLTCANVAALVFARTATREWEIAVRNALGASRGRIIGQLFVEALVLALVAAAVGLAAVRWGLKWVMGVFWNALGGQAPFWWDDGLAPATLLCAGGLAVLGAVIVGVVPALKVTGRGVQGRLRHAAAGGSGMRLGGLWTGVIITQVAFSVFILPAAIGLVRAWVRTEAAGLGFPAEEYLSVRLEMDRERSPGDSAAAAAFLSPFRATVQELERRLAAEPGVTGVTFADRFPGMNHPRALIEVDGPAAPATRRGLDRGESDQESALHRVQTASVDADFFDILGAPILSGRGFHSGDLGADRRVVIVNESFVHQILGDRNAIGRRFRYAPDSGDEEPGPWYEIVGVVKNLAMDRQSFAPGTPAGVYHPLATDPLAAGDAYEVRMAVHVRGDPGAFAPRLRGVATALDPTLRLHDVLPLDRTVGLTPAVQLLNKSIASGIAVVALLALLISASGTYALMSFTVARRTREIGIRAALGAGPRRIVMAIFSRALTQIGIGAVAGGAIYVAVMSVIPGDPAPDGQTASEALSVLLTVVTILVVTGLLACGVPAGRALRIQPTEALKEGG